MGNVHGNVRGNDLEESVPERVAFVWMQYN